MPFISAIGTHLPRWGCDVRRIVGERQDAITLGLEAGRAALRSGTAINQLDGARIALAHNISGPTAVSSATVLEGPGDGE